MHKVVVKSLRNMQQVVTTSSHEFIADEPVDKDGDDLGPTPWELMLSGLAT